MEKFNDTLQRCLHHVLLSDSGKQWHTKLPMLLWAYNKIPCSTTNVSPFCIVFGQVGRGPLSVLKNTWTEEKLPESLGKSAQEYLSLLRENLKLAELVASQTADKMQASYAAQYNKGTFEKSFEVGEQV